MSHQDIPDINAGAWYLLAQPDGGWAVCEPTSGEQFAEVRVDPYTHRISTSGDSVAAAAGAEAVRRWLPESPARPGG